MAPAGTCTEAGSDRTVAMLLKGKTVIPPAGAALDMVTAQVVEAPGTRLRLPHDSDVICAGATSERLAVLLAPFKLAVTDACWS